MHHDSGSRSTKCHIGLSVAAVFLSLSTGCQEVLDTTGALLEGMNMKLAEVNDAIANFSIFHEPATDEQMAEAQQKGEAIVLTPEEQHQVSERGDVIAVKVDDVGETARTGDAGQASATVAADQSRTRVILLDPVTREPISDDVIILEPQDGTELRSGDRIDLGEHEALYSE